MPHLLLIWLISGADSPDQPPVLIIPPDTLNERIQV